VIRQGRQPDSNPSPYFFTKHMTKQVLNCVVSELFSQYAERMPVEKSVEIFVGSAVSFLRFKETLPRFATLVFNRKKNFC
jgi:hypothetical protein